MGTPLLFQNIAKSLDRDTEEQVMEKRVAGVLPNLLGAAFAVLLLASRAVHAQSTAPADKK